MQLRTKAHEEGVQRERNLILLENAIFFVLFSNKISEYS